MNNLFSPRNPTWCPGCGNYGIWAALKQALTEEGLEGKDCVFVYGIGCSGNMADFLKAYGFHSLHGRALPNACGIKLANHSLQVICLVGDGDCYGEGGNHLLHAARGNHDIKVLVHDNHVYGLTTGQTSPTSPLGFKSKSTPSGVIEIPFSPLVLALTQGATFVAQGFAGDIFHLVKLIKAMLKHKGFALLNVLQPCVTFNQVTTSTYYREHTYKLEEKGHNPKNFLDALKKIIEEKDRLPLGVIYQEEKPAYHEQIPFLKEGPLVRQKRKEKKFYLEILKKYLA